MRASALNLDLLVNLFDLNTLGKITWNSGDNLVCNLLLHVAALHDNVLACGGRDPCGSVAEVVKEAIKGGWSTYEEAGAWIDGQDPGLQEWLTQMNSKQKWAMTKPLIKGAVGLALWTLVAYWPDLKFTSIQQVCVCVCVCVFVCARARAHIRVFA